MAMLHYFPTFHSLSSHKIFFHSKHPSPNFSIYHHSYSRFSASSLKKPRGSKKVKSNTELLCDIREFLSSTGFPEDHMPSMKELSEHGRPDLANIVRRRGYKFIRRLLETANTTNFCESDTDTGQSGNSEVLEGYEGQNEKLEVLDDDVLSSEANEEGVQSSFAFNSTTLSLQEKVAKFMKHGELEAIEDDGAETLNGNNISRNDYVSAEEQTLVDVEKMKDENQAEVKHLKLILHQKELELNHLKQQIEKEKAALSVLQAKAETEISNAQKLISEKETELIATEETLSDLKEVVVQFSGDGETVEVTGSFNGWHHKIKMDPHTSSNSKGSRKSRVWSTVLWLYPGIYEIKFIVDGHWRIDPQQESVTRDTLHNNILRVDR